jgi:hypothetical protein
MTQAILDGLALVVCAFVVCALAASVPLAIGMLIFASF